MKKKRVVIIVLIAVIALVVGALCAVFLPKYMKKTKHEQLISTLRAANFDKYYSEDGKFSDMTFGQVVDAYISDNVTRFDVIFECNEAMPEYSEIKELSDFEDYDYVCARVQTFFETIGGNKNVDSQINAIFKIDKSTNEVMPLGLSEFDSKSNSWKIDYIEQEESMILLLYDCISVYMEIIG